MAICSQVINLSVVAHYDDVIKWNLFPTDAELWFFFDLLLNKQLSKHRWGWWFETPSYPLWRHSNAWHIEHGDHWITCSGHRLWPVRHKTYKVVFDVSSIESHKKESSAIWNRRNIFCQENAFLMSSRRPSDMSSRFGSVKPICNRRRLSLTHFQLYHVGSNPTDDVEQFQMKIFEYN